MPTLLFSRYAVLFFLEKAIRTTKLLEKWKWSEKYIMVCIH